MGKLDGFTLSEIKAILEDLDGSRHELDRTDTRLLDTAMEALEKGRSLSADQVQQINEIWMRLA